MKLSESLETAFNAQITLEFQASLVYRQLAIELELMDLPGISRGSATRRTRRSSTPTSSSTTSPTATTTRASAPCRHPSAVVGSVLDAFEAA